MIFRHGLRAAAALALTAVFAAGAAAQPGSLNPKPEDSLRYNDIRDGRRLVKESSAQEEQKNIQAIKSMAQVQINRVLDAASVANGSSEAKPVSAAVRGVQNVIIDPLARNAKLTEGQRDLIQHFGREYNEQARSQIIGTGGKPSAANLVVKFNVARQLTLVARSGYAGLAQTAVDVLADPNQHDAVKLCMIQALYHLFTVPNPEDDTKSVFTDVALENKAIQALIDFIARKPADLDKMSQEEIDALRYLRRDAVKALGQTRKQIVRDKDGKVLMVPGLWLLRVANGDRSLTPPAGLSERAEALVGFLNLQADRDTNMDYASWFVCKAIQDLSLDFVERKPLPERVKLTDKGDKADEAKAIAELKAIAADDTKRPIERDYHPWKLTGNRIQVGLKVWRENWENPKFGARPEEVRGLMDRMIKAVDGDILRPMIENKRDGIERLPAQTWERNEKFPNTSLFTEDKSSVVVRPEGGR